MAPRQRPAGDLDEALSRTAGDRATRRGTHRMTIGIKYIGYPNSSGYGVTAFAYVRALHDAGVPVWWQPWFLWGEPHLWTPADRLRTLPLARATGGGARLAELRALIDSCTRPIEYDTVVCHTVPEDFARFVEAGKRMLGVTVWETDSLPRHWPQLLDAMDAVIVPSRLNAAVFERCGVSRPVHVVPYIRRLPLSAAAEEAVALRRQLCIPDDHFVFYSVGAWDPRKALEELMIGFAEEFRREEPVTLLIKTSRLRGDVTYDAPVEHRVREIVESAARRLDRAHANVVVIPADDVSTDTIDAIHALGDCYVSFAHGEGWGMGAFDAAALGKPVIITGWGGQTDYLGEDYPGLIRYQLTPVDAGWLHATRDANQRWARPDLQHASALMRAMVARDAAFFHAAARLRETIASRFAAPVVARRLLEAIDA